MTDLLAEVDDMMRRERVEKFWHEHRAKILGAIAALILVTALWSAWNAWDAHVKMRDTDKILSYISGGALPDAAQVKDLSLRPDAKAILLLTSAKSYLKQNKEDEALALYTMVGENRTISPELRHLGLLMETRMRADKENANLKELQKQLEKIYRDNNSPWRYHARIDAAALLAKSGNYSEAHEVLLPLLKEKDLPQTLAAKAYALDHVYATRAGENINSQGKKS